MLIHVTDAIVLNENEIKERFGHAVANCADLRLASRGGIHREDARLMARGEGAALGSRFILRGIDNIERAGLPDQRRDGQSRGSRAPHETTPRH